MHISWGVKEDLRHCAGGAIEIDVLDGWTPCRSSTKKSSAHRNGETDYLVAAERTLASVEGKSFQDSFHHSGADPLLEAAMAGLVGRITVGNVGPRSARPQYPRIPFRTMRRSIHGLPRPSLRRSGSEMMASIIAHWASVRSRDI